MAELLTVFLVMMAANKLVQNPGMFSSLVKGKKP
jgi:hypothetical protein